MIVADYLRMLTLDLLGQKYNKSEHRRRLAAALKSRSEGSIEFKHGNISAALVEMGFPYLRGYLPRENYQALLTEVLAAHVQSDSVLDQAAMASVQQVAIPPALVDFSAVKSDPPVLRVGARERAAPSFRAFKRDYLEREARNQSLGLAGEKFVLEYERWRLLQLGERELAERVEHVSRSKGDGLGYDVLSFEASGKERFIEVKTTSFGSETPFFVSSGELAFSKSVLTQFHLYRVFGFRKTPKLFNLSGALDANCMLDPVSYRASFS
jgi:hypothetical protein